MRRGLIPLLAVLVAGCGNNPEPGGDPPAGTVKVELTQVTAAELDQAIASHKGKVVLIDCWFLYCGPCRDKFPRVVQLHRDFAADGLVVMTLDILPDEWNEKEKVLKFLTDQKADFPNYIFADKPKALEAWQTKYDAEYTPAFVAFDRQGKWVPMPAIHPEGTMKEKEAAHAASERAFVKELLGK